MSASLDSRAGRLSVRVGLGQFSLAGRLMKDSPSRRSSPRVSTASPGARRSFSSPLSRRSFHSPSARRPPESPGERREASPSSQRKSARFSRFTLAGLSPSRLSVAALLGSGGSDSTRSSRRSGASSPSSPFPSRRSLADETMALTAKTTEDIPKLQASAGGPGFARRRLRVRSLLTRAARAVSQGMVAEAKSSGIDRSTSEAFGAVQRKLDVAVRQQKRAEEQREARKVLLRGSARLNEPLRTLWDTLGSDSSGKVVSDAALNSRAVAPQHPPCRDPPLPARFDRARRAAAPTASSPRGRRCSTTSTTTCPSSVASCSRGSTTSTASPRGTQGWTTGRMMRAARSRWTTRRVALRPASDAQQALRPFSPRLRRPAPHPAAVVSGRRTPPAGLLRRRLRPVRPAR